MPLGMIVLAAWVRLAENVRGFQELLPRNRNYSLDGVRADDLAAEHAYWRRCWTFRLM
ncbi:MAG: hypothetical protein JOZ81_10510 [Chloroflexi bacterium]|nr:hypothetical protein [Chloroflexota bacterium]